MTSFYTDRLSAAPGEPVRLHISSRASPLRLEISRIGAVRTPVLALEGLKAEEHPVPIDADSLGCGWPAGPGFIVGRDWRSGYYDLQLTDADGTEARHFVCVRRGAEARAKAVLILSTNTLQAYNYWGGRSAYCDVGALMSRRLALPEAMAGAIGVLSRDRPFPPLLLAAPEDMPRLVNSRKRGFQERTWAGADPAWSRAHGQSPYDGSAGFLNKWEHKFVAWAEGEEGMTFDYLTDQDLDEDPSALDGYACALLVGHSEYWSGPERDVLEAFVDAGGGLAIFSGNTAFWKVRWEEGGRRLICHKWKGFEADPAAAADPAVGTHLWSHPAFGRPEASITGLSFLYGGYHRLGLCAARGSGGYTVYRDRHWALEGSDLYYGDVFGDAAPLVGYENDGCRIAFSKDNLPVPAGLDGAPDLGVPKNLEIIALAPAAFAETPSPYRPLIPPEQLDVVARIAYGADDLQAQERVLRGHAVMASFRRGQGEVFNAGSTEWAHGLSAGDPFVTTITRNVLRRFGAI
jgi:hypothetical protein